MVAVNVGDLLRRSRMRKYKSLFMEDGELREPAKDVLADLKKFCRGDRSTHVIGDPYASANLEGRREVWLRICAFLNLTEADFYGLTEEIDYERGTGTAGGGAADIGDFD